jgi:hypothetical protein
LSLNPHDPKHKEIKSRENATGPLLSWPLGIKAIEKGLKDELNFPAYALQ